VKLARWTDWLLLVGLLLIAASMLAIGVAYGAPPPGADLQSAEHRWWECWHAPDFDYGGYRVPGSSCCSEADGHNLSDSDWRVKPDSSGYQVRVENAWFDVPPSAVVRDQNCGPEPNVQHRAEAKVWYKINRGLSGAITALTIHCFRVGMEY
jgi:hypothetical protein